MKCTVCGTEAEAGVKFCPYCGANMEQQPQTANAQISEAPQTVYNANGTVASAQATPSKNNGFATAGFVLGLISFCCCSLCGIGTILGIIFSILGLKSERKGFAIAGLVLSILAIVSTIVSWLWLPSLPFTEEYYQYIEDYLCMLF